MPLLNMNKPDNRNRVSMYRSKIQLDDFNRLMTLDLQKDDKKMYFVLVDELTKVRKEIQLYLKQATQVLMYCHNDFRRFVGEMLCVKYGKVMFRDINKVVEKVAIENIRMATEAHQSQTEIINQELAAREARKKKKAELDGASSECDHGEDDREGQEIAEHKEFQLEADESPVPLEKSD